MANLAHEMLREEAEQWRKLYAMYDRVAPRFTFKDWLLANGEECGERVKRRGLPLMQKKQCFCNSMTTIIRREVDTNEWFYTEGVVASPDLPLLIDHAWLTNKKGEVLDRTLRSNGHSYFGIPFKPDFAIAKTMEHGIYGLFSNGVMYHPLITKPVKRGRAWKRREEDQ